MVQETAWYFQQFMVSSKPDLAMTVKANYKDNKPLYSLPLDNFFLFCHHYRIITFRSRWCCKTLEYHNIEKNWDWKNVYTFKGACTYVHTLTVIRFFQAARLHPLPPPSRPTSISLNYSLCTLGVRVCKGHRFDRPTRWAARIQWTRHRNTSKRKKEQEKVWTFIQAYFVLFS